jgi:HK97 family phage major capsid protein
MTLTAAPGVLETLNATRDKLRAQIAELSAPSKAEGRSLTASEARKIRPLGEELSEINDLVAAAEHRAQRARQQAQIEAPFIGTGATRAEDRTYSPDGEFSFFKDLAATTRGDLDAMQRLAQHQIERRTNPDRTNGRGGEFVPPLWLEEQYIPLARPARAFADLCTNRPLPAGTDSINIPKITGGSSVGWQSDGGAVSSTDPTTSSVSASVLTLAGQVDIAQQLIDQSPIAFDQAIFGDLTAELNKQLDLGCLTGAGTPGVPTGAYNVSNIATVTYTDASPTLPELYSKLANAIQTVETTRYLPPEAIVMHPRRWAWMLASLDSQNRPLVTPHAGAFNPVGVLTNVAAQAVVGEMLGLPVVVDPSIPTAANAPTLTGGNQDVIFVGRWSDLYLWESELYARAFPSVLSGTLQVRLQVYKYVAFAAGRYPASIAVVSGTGLSTPSF